MELLVIEIYIHLNDLSPDIMNTIFKLKQETYNLRSLHIYESQNLRIKQCGLKCIAASQLWKNVPEEVSNSISLPSFLVDFN